MELLQGYGPSDEEDEAEQEGVEASEADDTVSVLPGFEGFKPAPAQAPGAVASPAVGAAAGGGDRVRPGPAHGGDSDGTPGPGRLRHPGLRAVSKSSTPVIHGSPAPHQSAPSDDSVPNSPARRGSAPAGDTEEKVVVSLPDKPLGEVDGDVAKRVEHYMRLRGDPKPVKVNSDLYDKKEFHNPGILEMLMSQYKIKETGTNYPTVCLCESVSECVSE
jgi:hypothetical protein